MPHDHIPKQLFYGELWHGKRTVEGQRQRFNDCLKVSLKDFNSSTESWESLASYRPCWRHLITKGANTADSAGPSKPSRRELHARPEPPAPPARHLPSTVRFNERSSEGRKPRMWRNYRQFTDWQNCDLGLSSAKA